MVDRVVRGRATAVVVHTDDAGQLLVHLLRAAGVRVPDDCSVRLRRHRRPDRRVCPDECVATQAPAGDRGDLVVDAAALRQAK
ncbi:MAG: hypothetical protein ACR2I1_07675 [Propionibacteriaceae bacterium]